MPRELDSLTRDRFDVLVIGGGIHGLFCAYDAAQRGLRVALVDRADFGSGLSFNHQRTLHGGLRALEKGRVLKTRRLIQERRVWANIAPHLLRPLPFLVATYRFSRRSRLMLRAGFKIYDLVGRHRNRGVSPELHLPKAKLESAAATRRLFQGVSEPGLTGGAVWYDYQTKHPDRLTWTVALAARQAGATLHNYVEAVGALTEGGRTAGARVRDVLTGTELEIRAAATILAVGGAAGPVSGIFGLDGAPPMVRAMNLLLDRPARDIASVAPGPNGRMLTAVPWSGYVLVGTHQSAGIVGPDEAEPPDEAIEVFLAEANETFPTLKASRGDIRFVHHGLTPAARRNAGADLLAESRVDRAPSGGLISVIGVKYTTARQTAARAVDVAARDLGKPVGRSRTGEMALPHAGIADNEGRLIEAARQWNVSLDREVVAHLAGWYGTEAADVLAFSQAEGLTDRLTGDGPILQGEVAYAVVHAQACRLTDVVMRRTPLGSAGHPGRAALEAAASLMAGRLGWSADERAAQIADVERRYPRR